MSSVRVLWTVAVLLVLSLACPGPSSANDGEQRFEHLGPGVAVILSQSAFQGVALGLTIADCARRDDDLRDARNAMSAIALATYPLTVFGYSMAHWDGTRRRQELGAGLGFVHSGAVGLATGILGLVATDSGGGGAVHDTDVYYTRSFDDSLVVEDLPIAMANLLTGVVCMGIGLPLLLGSFHVPEDLPAIAVAPWGGPHGAGVQILVRR